MIMTENLMVLLYDEAVISGDPEQQVKTLAEQNRITEDEVITILERNGCDVEKFMAKKERASKKLTTEVKKQPEEIKNLVEEENPMEDAVTMSGPIKEDDIGPALQIPEVVFNLVNKKIDDNRKIIDYYMQQIEKIEKEQDELSEFMKIHNKEE